MRERKDKDNMGIAVKTLLEQEFFKDFYIVAGAKGLHKEVQGIAVMDAPGCLSMDKRERACHYFRIFDFYGAGLYEKVLQRWDDADDFRNGY